ncbi:hypothetical protein RQP46_005384 [Phenoliferia psychrophenolica]
MVRSPSPTPSDSSSQGLASFMEEPASFRPSTPPPTTVPYTRRPHGGHGPLIGPSSIDVKLVSGHPLWGHILYPAAIALATFLELHSDALLLPSPSSSSDDPEGKGKGRAKNVLELGAGGGLPGLVAALEGAANVVISDFPDADLVNNLQENVDENVGKTDGVAKTFAAGFTWGSSPTSLFSLLPSSSPSFDIILLSDLVFNHSQHAALLDTCLACLSPSPSSPPAPSSTTTLDLPEMDLSTPETLKTPIVLCFFSHHRPTNELVAADLGLLTMAKARGWTVRRVWKDAGAGPAFPEDGGDLCVRSTVHGFAFTRE